MLRAIRASNNLISSIFRFRIEQSQSTSDKLCYSDLELRDEPGLECSSVKGENWRVEIIRSVSGKGGSSDDGIGRLVEARLRDSIVAGLQIGG